MLRPLLFLIAVLICLPALGGQVNNGLGVNIGATIRAQSGPTPKIISTLPADGSTVNTNTPTIRVVFDIDMDTLQTDPTKVFVPVGMTATTLVWSNPRTLDIQYTGSLPGFGPVRVDLADKYFVSAGMVSIAINSGFAFNYGPAVPNGAPIVAAPATASQTLTGVGDSVAFTVAAGDPDGDPLSFSWNFGDGSPAVAGQNPTHIYNAVGVYTATVTISDGKGGTTTSQVSITVGDGGGRPIVISSVPIDGSSVNTPSPVLSVNFNVDMDTSRIDPTKVVLPLPLNVTSLDWTGKRTLNIHYQGQLDSYGAKRVDLKDMYFVNSVNEAIPEGSGFAFEYANPNHQPYVVQGPTANPGVAIGGNPIKFDAVVFDPDNDALSFTWDFGDGTTGSGLPVTHTYAVSGSYLATLTVNDGRGGVANGSVLLGALASAPWNVTRMMVGLNFKTGRDKITIQGVADLPPAFDPTGKKVSVNVGGITQNWTLSKNGQGKTGKDIFRLRRKLKRRVFLGGACKVAFSLSGALAKALVDEGLISMDTPKIGVHRLIDVNMIIDGRPFIGQATVLYKAKLGKTGRGKLTTPIK